MRLSRIGGTHASVAGWEATIGTFLFSAIISTSPAACSACAESLKSIVPVRPCRVVEYVPCHWPARIPQSARLASTGTGAGLEAHPGVAAPIAKHSQGTIMSHEYRQAGALRGARYIVTVILRCAS